MKMNMLWVLACCYTNKKRHENHNLVSTSVWPPSTMSILTGLIECQNSSPMSKILKEKNQRKICFKTWGPSPRNYKLAHHDNILCLANSIVSELYHVWDGGYKLFPANQRCRVSQCSFVRLRYPYNYMKLIPRWNVNWKGWNTVFCNCCDILHKGFLRFSYPELPKVHHPTISVFHYMRCHGSLCFFIIFFYFKVSSSSSSTNISM